MQNAKINRTFAMDRLIRQHFHTEEKFDAYCRTRELLREYNALPYRSLARKDEIIRSLLGETGEFFRIEAPFCCDFGQNIFLGENVFINFNCTILDGAKVTIGSDTIIAPNVQICATGHPTDPKARHIPDGGGTRLAISAKPVSIGSNCWLGAGCIVTPGVSIGDNCTIGAGSVVVKDIPPDSLAVGSPARVVKSFQ